MEVKYISVRFLLFQFCLAASARADFTCTAEGLFADPDHCENYIQCALGEMNEDGSYDYVEYVNTCPQGTDGVGLLYDACIRVCEDPAIFEVECGPRPLPDGAFEEPGGDIYADCPENAPPPEGGTTAPMDTTEDNGNTQPPSPPTRYPFKVIGFQLPLADDYEEGYGTEDDWYPELYEYQQECANLLFFTYINPANMTVPNSFIHLASSRGTDLPGAVPANTLILFTIGGYAYSYEPNPWDWLTTREKAEAMAEEVSQWRLLYNMNGIDIEIESGAGDAVGAGENLVYFLEKLRELDPGIIINQPTFGYPQISAEIDVINASWNADGSSNDLADSISIMVYEGTTSLDYIENYAHGSEQFPGYAITCNVPYNAIMTGSKGVATPEEIETLASEVVKQDLLGLTVYYCSVIGGMNYGAGSDLSFAPESQEAYCDALETITA